MPQLNTPTNLTAIATQDGVKLTWRDNSQQERGFAVERSISSTNNWVQIITVAKNVTSYIDRNIQPSTSYDYRVRAIA